MNLEEAKGLVPYAWVHSHEAKNADGSSARFRVTSVRTWVRSPFRVRIGLKRGLYEFLTLDETDMSRIHMGDSCGECER